MYVKGRKAYVRILEELGRGFGGEASNGDLAASNGDVVDPPPSPHVADEL